MSRRIYLGWKNGKEVFQPEPVKTDEHGRIAYSDEIVDVHDFVLIEGKLYYFDDLWTCGLSDECPNQRYFLDPFKIGENGLCEDCEQDLFEAKVEAAEVREQYYFGQIGK